MSALLEQLASLDNRTDTPLADAGTAAPDAGHTVVDQTDGHAPSGAGGHQSATGHRRPWRMIVAVVAVVALVAALVVYGMGQRSQLASTRRTLASTRTELSAEKAALASTNATLTSTQATLDTTRTDLATLQGQSAALTAERDQLRNQLGLAQSDLARITSIRDAMKVQLQMAPDVINAAMTCWSEDIDLFDALDDFVRGNISVTRLNQLVEAHNAAHQAGTCGTNFTQVATWLNGLNSFGISPNG